MDNKSIWLEIKDKNDLLPVANALLKSGYIIRICKKKNAGVWMNYIVAVMVESEESAVCQK